MPAPPEAEQRAPIRLLIVSHYFEGHRGGVEIVAGRLARALAALGLEVNWAATGGPAPLDPAFRTIPLRAWNVAERRIGIPFPILSINAIRQLWSACRAADAVIVHDALYLTSIIGRMAARSAMIVQHIGSVDYRNPLLRLAMGLGNRLVARPMLRSADRLVFISETTRAQFGFPATQSATTIFNGVDLSLFRPPAGETEKAGDRAALALPADRKLALFVGRFVEKKGLPRLRRMAEARPDIAWALAGWGPIDPSRWDLSNVHVFRDLQGETLARLYRAADVFVLPSIGEGFPLVIQEALAAGLPIATGNETAAADPAATSLLAGVDITDSDGQTAERFLAVIDRLLAAAPRTEERRQFARDHYSWAAAATKYKALIEAMLCDEGVR